MYPMFLLRKNMTQLFKEFYNRMPGSSMVGFYFAREPALLIRDPELVKSVFQTEYASFNKNGTAIDPNIDRLLSRNPFFLPGGEQWKSSRQQLSSAYTSGKLKYMYESINMACNKLDKYLDRKIAKAEGKLEIESKELFSRFTAEAVASAAFGIEGDAFEEDREGTFVEIGKSIFEPSTIKGIQLILVTFFPFLGRLFNAGMIPPRVDRVFRSIIKDMITYRADNNRQRQDFLQVMINQKKTSALDHRDGSDFNDETIISHSASFFLEGYETSSISLSFVGYQLARHTEIQQRVRDEVVAMVEKHDGITYEALQEMTYMDQVIYESMRLYPAAGDLTKICTAEVVLKGSDGITCEVTPGTRVMISLHGLHMDPAYWPEPQKFDPERFSEENKRSRHRFTYLTFGEGPRVCVGMRIAMLQMKAGLATVIKKYSLELSPRTQIPIKLDPHYFMASAIGGLWINVKHL